MPLVSRLITYHKHTGRNDVAHERTGLIGKHRLYVHKALGTRTNLRAVQFYLHAAVIRLRKTKLDLIVSVVVIRQGQYYRAGRVVRHVIQLAVQVIV